MMVAKMAQPQYSLGPAPPHELRRRPMTAQERHVLSEEISKRVAPFVAVPMTFIIVVVIMLSVAGTDDPFCEIAAVLGFVAFIMIIVGISQISPLQRALTRGTVTDIRAVCTPLTPYTRSVGPLQFNPDPMTGVTWPDNVPVTVGFLEGTFFIVSKDGMALGKAQTATSSYNISQLPATQWAPPVQQSAQGDVIITTEQVRNAQGQVITTRRTMTRGPQQAQPANTPLVIQTPGAQPVQINIVSPEKPSKPEAPSKRCPRCNEPVKDNWKSCPSCNAVLIEEPPPPKPVEVVEPKAVVEPPKFCPFHGYKTTLKEGKAWCPRCSYFVDAPPEFCPIHGCRTELKDSEAYCPRCEAVVKPL